tara:strand:- start:177708 stop:178133 length:426 start_codon:yes stop_codon:yes gene_type:complete
MIGIVEGRVHEGSVSGCLSHARKARTDNTAIVTKHSYGAVIPVPSPTAMTDAAGKPATTHRGEIMQRSMNVLALVKDSERYVFLYDEDSAASLLQTLGKYAADKDLSFTWYDAAVLSQKVRKLRQEAESEQRSNRLPETAW